MFSFDELDPLTAVLVYALANLVITSVCPVPLGVFMIVAAGLMWGAVWGGLIYLSTCACGSAITFALARCMRPRLLARLGDKHRRTFNTLDAALVADGVMIAILWRVAPIAPFVLSSALLSLTSISFGTYFWTTVVGCVPSTLPILLGADFAGREVAGDGERSWLSVGANVLSLVCAVVVVVKLGKIAVDVFRRHGFAQVDDEDEEGDEEEAEAETPTRVARGESSPAVLTRARSPSWSESMGVPRELTRQMSLGGRKYVRTVALL